MHASTGFSWWVDGLRYYLLFVVPALMLVVIVDSARREVVAFKRGRLEQVVFAASALLIVALLGSGLLWPSVPLLGLAAVLIIPGSLLFGAAYLLRVVYRLPVPAAAASSEDAVPPSTE